MKNQPDLCDSPCPTPNSPESQHHGLELQICPQKWPVTYSLMRRKATSRKRGIRYRGFAFWLQLPHCREWCLLAVRLKTLLEEPRSGYLHRHAEVIFLASSLALAKPGSASSAPLDELLSSWEGASRAGARQMSPSFSSSPPRTACIRVIYVTPDFSSCLLCGEPDGFSVCLGACLSTLFLPLTVVLAVVVFGE